MAADPAAIKRAHRLAEAAEQQYEEGRWTQAVAQFEAASDAYVSATLATTDTDNVQNLRLLALSHLHRAHELKLRMRLHGVQAASESEADAAAQAAAAAPKSGDGKQAALGDQKSGGGGGDAVSHGVSPEASSAMARLGSQLISTFEEMRFGADDIARILLPVNSPISPMASGGMGASAMGSGLYNKGAKQQLIASFCVVPPHPHAAGAGTAGMLAAQLVTSQALQQSSVLSGAQLLAPASGGGSGGVGSGVSDEAGGSQPRLVHASALLERQPSRGEGAEGEGSLRASLAQLAVENGRLARENAALRQRSSELSAVFGKAQRRAADQQRLARKALTALREVHAVPRPEVPPDASKEIADLRRQLETAHTARRQQAELVRKYEQRWAQLKASARKKQQAQAQAQQATAPPQGS